MRLIWKGNWKMGEITIETETPEEMIKAIQKLGSDEKIKELRIGEKTPSINYPQIPGNLGCSEAVREALRSPWGRKEPRTMTELIDALKASALFFTKGTMSGTLSLMTKAGRLRRLKKGDMWAYVISE